jgi:hypothetical protein
MPRLSRAISRIPDAATNRRVPTAAGPTRVDALPARLPARAWQKYSAGAGSHGHRFYAWAWIALDAEDSTDTGHHHLLIRRNDRTGELRLTREWVCGRKLAVEALPQVV